MSSQRKSGPGGKSSGSGGKPSGPGGKARRGRYTHRRKICQFCVDKVITIDYKDTARFRRFISERSKIEPRRKTGVCAGHQRDLSVAIKRARHLALVPFTAAHVR